MNRLTLLTVTLAACNPWIRSQPDRPALRDFERQQAATVRIESYCDPFEDGTLGKAMLGSGVMVSDWQVLTVIHVVDCQAAIPTIHVTNHKGQRWKFLPEKEWEMTYVKAKGRDGVARIQMASGDSLSPSLPPPSIRPYPTNYGDSLFIEAGSPEFEGSYEQATGWEYGGDEYGGHVLTYVGWTEEGNSGGAMYDSNGDLAGLHMGVWPFGESVKYGAVVTPEMIPH